MTKKKPNWVYRTQGIQNRINENITCAMTCDFPFPNSGAKSKPAWTNLNKIKEAELQNTLLASCCKEWEPRSWLTTFRDWRRDWVQNITHNKVTMVWPSSTFPALFTNRYDTTSSDWLIKISAQNLRRTWLVQNQRCSMSFIYLADEKHGNTWAWRPRTRLMLSSFVGHRQDETLFNNIIETLIKIDGDIGSYTRTEQFRNLKDTAIDPSTNFEVIPRASCWGLLF